MTWAHDAPVSADAAAPRDLSEAGHARLVEVAEGHRARGWHSAAQLAVYRDGRLALDLRLGAAADPASRMLWFSATKPVITVCVLMLVERGRLALDAPLAELWPEFAQGGKAACTLRHVLTHRGGFPALRRDVDWRRVEEWDYCAAETAAIPAAWEPGSATGYHPVTFGFALGELIRRVDGREPRDFLRDELFAPLGLDASLGVDDAALDTVVPLEALSEVTWQDPEGTEGRTSEVVRRFNAPSTLRAQIPAGNGIGTAEALARFYAMLERGGELDGVRVLSEETAVQATSIQHRTSLDRTTGLPGSYGWGFVVGGVFAPFDRDGVFGHPGQQSSIGYADPSLGLAVAYVTNGLHDPLVVQTRVEEVAQAAVEACAERAARP
jgi:CubicO group peptidase (beta-lactamase class C family)